MSQFPTIELYDRLAIAELKWEKTGANKEELEWYQSQLTEIGRRAIAIRDMNNKRIAFKNTIAEKLNDPVREVKQDHLSE